MLTHAAKEYLAREGELMAGIEAELARLGFRTVEDGRLAYHGYYRLGLTGAKHSGEVQIEAPWGDSPAEVARFLAEDQARLGQRLTSAYVLMGPVLGALRRAASREEAITTVVALHHEGRPPALREAPPDGWDEVA